MDAPVSGNIVYSEDHSVVTNNLGLINIAIGQGIYQNNPLGNINWGASNYYIEIFIDFSVQGNFLSMGLSQFLSVPYALYAKSSGNTLNVGATGMTGPLGSTGNQGIQGVVGIQGSTGNKGPDRAAGAQGDKEVDNFK